MAQVSLNISRDNGTNLSVNVSIADAEIAPLLVGLTDAVVSAAGSVAEETVA